MCASEGGCAVQGDDQNSWQKLGRIIIPNTSAPMDRFLGRAAPARLAPDKKKAKAAVATSTGLPETQEGYNLPEELNLMLREQKPLGQKRVCWPIPARLGFGCSPMDRLEPATWLRANNVRVVVDVTFGGVQNLGRYGAVAHDADATLVLLPLSSKYKMKTSAVDGYLAACRTLHRVLHETANAEHPFAIYVCDSRGGGVAALIVAMFVAMETPCRLADACVYVTRCWNTNLADSVQPSRMYPEGDVLKTAIVSLFARLRDQPIGASVPRPANQKLYAMHRCKSIAQASEWLLDLDPALFVRIPAFTRADPMSILLWSMKTMPVREAVKRDWTCRDDDDDGDRRRFRGRSNWNHADDHDEGDDRD